MIKKDDLVYIPAGMASNNIAILLLIYLNVFELSAFFMAKMTILFVILAIGFAFYSIKTSMLSVGSTLHSLLISFLVNAGVISFDLTTMFISTALFIVISLAITMWFEKREKPDLNT